MFNFKAACLNTAYTNTNVQSISMPAFNMPSFFGFPNLFNFNNSQTTNSFEFGFNQTTPKTFTKSDYASTNVFDFSKTVAPALPKYDFSNVSLATFTRKENILNKNKGLLTLANANYNADKGEKLAQKAANNAKSSSTGYCAKGVKNAIAATGLGEYESGNACDMAAILKDNKNFKEVNVSKNDLTKLPAGAIVIYPKGDAGYSSKYGHVEIALGDGRAASDFINSNVKSSENARVFIPV